MHKTDPQYAIQERFLDQPYTIAGRLIDPVSGMLSWQGKREHFRRKELQVLALLASSDGKQVSRDNFIASVWQSNDLAQHKITAAGLTVGVEEAQLAPRHAPPNWQADAELSAADDAYLNQIAFKLSSACNCKE